LAVAGNGKGLLGIGWGKAEEPEDARAKALQMAIRNMRPVPMYESRTIFGDVEGKCGAVRVELMSRPPGMLSYTLQSLLQHRLINTQDSVSVVSISSSS
jgi:ribosomal protein S5